MVEDYCPSVSLTTPVFIRFRSDKKINISDIGLNQIERIIAFGEEKESVDKAIAMFESKGNKSKDLWYMETKQC